ncbi:putative dual specificity tyrosine-phosphorylation-regulated kinase 3 homolog isoform X1 [Rhagoletis pomonella]|uniref:putative dual specificity tyrosine-phosphorylation-regulated kinase 3 homolog isoform X1 n=1 Tax=Rhagoletis pomonella TaxID=28610 RepID=UPI0017873DF5|nr:putative dual specificity tyrosine-phosphorylation-regulated kinase 3 homolog isoform X1 [Rhagoletis pomonella]XP_036335079.1 putative dual specificity tyrosine-phosphorylation-regulated kinase 3 homolog isoform X1 [Rhagoletis pomonella]XP_036335080.1 putative dual specificity tyrosine-phosphorylation-regulated kinase 3 homolog isoform X1 [Rhagoletis pomonella]XP_036335081.1 putative dual specificity tyrosine-phosphorylation-regulated kinase 3 homolog isoform X1 [Rhagoletis pomonella]
MPIPQHKTSHKVINERACAKFETLCICAAPITSINENGEKLYRSSDDKYVKNISKDTESSETESKFLDENTSNERQQNLTSINVKSGCVNTSYLASDRDPNNKIVEIQTSKNTSTKAAHKIKSEETNIQAQLGSSTNILSLRLASSLPIKIISGNSDDSLLLKSNNQGSAELKNNNCINSNNSRTCLSLISNNNFTTHSTTNGNTMVGAQKKTQQLSSAQTLDGVQNASNHNFTIGHDRQHALLVDAPAAAIQGTTKSITNQSGFKTADNHVLEYSTAKMSDNFSGDVIPNNSRSKEACTFTDDAVVKIKRDNFDLITTIKTKNLPQNQFLRNYDINSESSHSTSLAIQQEFKTDSDSSDNALRVPIPLTANLNILQLQQQTDNIPRHLDEHQLTNYTSNDSGTQEINELEKGYTSKSLTALSLARIISTATSPSSAMPTPISCARPDCNIPFSITTIATTSAESIVSTLNPGTTTKESQLHQPSEVAETFSFHEQIIMSGQQKCALQAKPKPLVVSPQQVMVLYMHKLTPYERTEILAYPQIYFIGANAKKRPGIFGPNNSDYDNDQGAYIHIPHDHVAYRYEMLKVIGKGSFGQVIKAYDHKTHEHVALKMVRNEKRFHRQAQEEIRILHHLRRQDKYNTMNIIHMFDYFTFRNHMCITFELLNINLYELIKKNGFKGFSLQLVRKFAHSLLQCLDALYKNEIIHCDMKPENVLLKQQGRSGIKVIDFGSSCYESQRVYTYIQSRFYRAPEVILGSKYGRAIDMWSLGCILAELLSGHALFPGENESDQLACIIEVLGMPNKNLLTNAKRAKAFFNPKGFPRYCTVRTMTDGTVVLIGGQSRRGKPRGPPCSKSLSKALDGCKDALFLNFIRGCLEWDAEKRLTPAEALKHPWLRRRLPRPPNCANCPSERENMGSNGGSNSKSATGDRTPIIEKNQKRSGFGTNIIGSSLSTTSTSKDSIGGGVGFNTALISYNGEVVPSISVSSNSLVQNTIESTSAFDNIIAAAGNGSSGSQRISSCSNRSSCKSNSINKSNTSDLSAVSENAVTLSPIKCQLSHFTSSSCLLSNVSNQCGCICQIAGTMQNFNAIQCPKINTSNSGSSPPSVTAMSLSPASVVNISLQNNSSKLSIDLIGSANYVLTTAGSTLIDTNKKVNLYNASSIRKVNSANTGNYGAYLETEYYTGSNQSRPSSLSDIISADKIIAVVNETSLKLASCSKPL